MGLSEMIYGTSVKNISHEESFFDMLITQEFSPQIKDPNHFQINRFHMEKIHSTSLSKCFTLVDRASSYLKNEAVNPGPSYSYLEKEDGAGYLKNEGESRPVLFALGENEA